MHQGETERVLLVKVGGRGTERERERSTRDGISPVCQPASLVYAPGHPLMLQVAIPLRLSSERAAIRREDRKHR